MNNGWVIWTDRKGWCAVVNYMFWMTEVMALYCQCIKKPYRRWQLVETLSRWSEISPLFLNSCNESEECFKSKLAHLITITGVMLCIDRDEINLSVFSEQLQFINLRPN